MSAEPIQNPLFDDPLGLTLKHARLRKDLTMEAAARQLRLPVAVIDAMEREAWQKLGAPIYVKSYLGSYLKLLGLPESLLSTLANTRTEATLVAMKPISNVRRTLDRSWRRIVYLVMTGVLVGSVAMLAMHLQSRMPASDSVALLGAPLDLGVSGNSGSPVPRTSQSTPEVGVPADASLPQASQSEPVAASLAPMPVIAVKAELVLRFRGESWIDIVDNNGQHIERGMVVVGTERRYPPGSVARLTLGNASMVDVLQDGQPIDIKPYLSEDVARFAVSSDGRITAPGG